MGLVEELSTDNVPEGVVFFVDGEGCRVGHFGVGDNSDLLFVAMQQEVLKSVRTIHGCKSDNVI